MPGWVRGFVVRDVNEMHSLFRELLILNERLELISRRRPGAIAARARLARVRELYGNFNREVRLTQIAAAVQATNDIRDRLTQTQVRPDTDSSPHLRDLIACRPLNIGNIATGMVGIGDVSELDRAINRRTPGYGSYWRAQEYGTGFGDVPSQVGRIIHGFFAAAGGGDATPPQAQYRGGGGPHPVFLNKRPIYGSSAERQALGATGAGGTRAGPAGLGTIGFEIQPKHFIRYGADAAAVAWRARLAVIQTQVVDGLATLPV